MVTRIEWTADEKRLLARECVVAICSPLPKGEQVFKVSDAKARGFFSVIFSEAQKEVFAFDAERIRPVKQHSQVPWLLNMMQDAAVLLYQETAPDTAPGQEENAPAETQPFQFSVNGADMQRFAELLAPLVSQHVVKSLAETYDLPLRVVHEKARPVLPVAVKADRKPAVLIVGLLPIQQSEVKLAWGKKFDLKFIEQDKRLTNCLAYDYAIGLVTKMPHTKDAKLSSAFGQRYLRVNGCTSSVKKELNDLSSRLGR